MKLLIDAGNTRIKWALVDAGEWVSNAILPVTQVSDLAREVSLCLSGFETSLPDIDQIWVSNVAGAEVAGHIDKIVAGQGCRPRFIVSQKFQCGVSNGYADPAQLGSDRWAALIAAWHLVHGTCLVVNCGTATTIDALSGQGIFIGGLILPGVKLMQGSLITATGQVRTARQGEYVLFPGNTGDALFSGAIQASCGAIAAQYALLCDDDAPVVLSGGAAATLEQRIAVPLKVVDNLVLQGLYLIAEDADKQ